MATLFARISNLVSVATPYLRNNKTSIDELVIDATHAVVINFSNVITDHPIEKGDNLNSGSFASDHIYKNPLKIRIEGSIIDSPVDIIGSARSIIDIAQSGEILQEIKNKLKGKSSKEITAYEALKNIYESGAMIDVVTYVDVFSNMVMENLVIHRDEETGRRLTFTAELKQIILSEVKYTNITNNTRSEQDLITPKVSVGRQETLTVTPIEEAAIKKSSGLYSIGKKLLGGI